MANYVKILIRRDTTTNWTANNPVLSLGEIAADMTLHRLKVGDGVSTWNALPFLSAEVVNDLITGGTSKALSAEQGKELKSLIDGKADNSTVTNLQTSISNIQQRITNIEGESGKGSIFGIGYTVDNYNGYGKPTKITFSDGVTATLSWSGTRLIEINASTGEKIIQNYDTNGRITGRTVTGG